MYHKIVFLLLSCAIQLASAHAQMPMVAGIAKSIETNGSPVSAEELRRENWAVLPLDKSGIDVDRMGWMLLGKYEQPEYTRELYRVEWRSGDPIDLYVIMPHGVKNPSVVLYLYDYRWDTDRFRNDRWCKQATQGGVAAVGFVSALSGQRFHAPRPMKQWFVSELQEALSTSTHDVQMVLNFLTSHTDLDTSHVGIFGEGSGGAVAVLAASVDSRITTLDLLNPWGDWPDWLKDSKQIPEEERAAYLKPEFLKKVSTMDPITYLPALKNRSVRVLQVMSDLVTPSSARDKIAGEISDPERLVRFSDTNSFFEAARKGSLSSWIPDHLHSSRQQGSNESRPQ